jgi:AcrR family transcriptional regulator
MVTMAVTDGLPLRQAKRLQTRERLFGAAIAEFKRAGMAEADVGAVVAAAGVAHGTFFFHFPTKEHVLLELETREEARIANQFARYVNDNHDLLPALKEATRLIMALERRLGPVLFKDVLALHFSQTRPPGEDGEDHPLIVLVAREFQLAKDRGDVAPDVNPMNSAVFFLLGLYGLLTTMNAWATRDAVIADYLTRTLRSLQAR